MKRIDTYRSRRGLLRLARVGLLGAASLTLVMACSNYGTTGSGGTTGAGPTNGTTAGSGSGGLVPTPSGGSNATSGGRDTSGQDSRTAGNPPSGTVLVPTPNLTGVPSGPAVPRNASGTPETAGSGAGVATVDALNPAAVIPVTRSASPAILPTPTSTATSTP